MTNRLAVTAPLDIITLSYFKFILLANCSVFVSKSSRTFGDTIKLLEQNMRMRRLILSVDRIA